MIRFNQDKTSYMDKYSGWLQDIESYFTPVSSQTVISSGNESDPFDLIPTIDNPQQVIRVAPASIQETWVQKLEDLFGYGQNAPDTNQISSTTASIFIIGGLAVVGYFMFFRKK